MEHKFLSRDIGKRVLTLGGDVLGTVKGALLSTGYKRVAGYTCFEEENGEEFCFCVENVFRVGTSAVVLKENPTPPQTAFPSPVGLTAFSLDGDGLGVVTDIALDGDRVTTLVTPSGEYPLNRIVSVGQSVMIDLATPRTRLPLSRKKERQVEEVQTNVRYGDQLLLGRKIKKDVYNQRGERLAKEGQIVTREILEEVKKYGKLAELTAVSLSNLL